MTVAPVESCPDTARHAVQQGDAKLPLLVEFFPLLLVEQAVSHGGDVRFVQDVFISDDDFAVDAKGRRDTYHLMQIRGIELARIGQQPIKFFCAHWADLSLAEYSP